MWSETRHGGITTWANPIDPCYIVLFEDNKDSTALFCARLDLIDSGHHSRSEIYG